MSSGKRVQEVRVESNKQQRIDTMLSKPASRTAKATGTATTEESIEKISDNNNTPFTDDTVIENVHLTEASDIQPMEEEEEDDQTVVQSNQSPPHLHLTPSRIQDAISSWA